ncbi:hypothetical protein J2S74_004999 [Evansella vedderi]|uniref:Uncharacterized protein n=1 Tax=Evansella vedderi TaxID=38282 RepID=A0ABU0A222_9BACI|nr:hypothetical protein [Evansella vedderi]MDQ0257541.1 hypothetical protein [Evansella vedderi]
MLSQNYEKLSDKELEAYYKRVKNYIEQGFRVDGLKEELQMIYDALEKKSDLQVKNKNQYLEEINYYIKTLRL